MATTEKNQPVAILPTTTSVGESAPKLPNGPGAVPEWPMGRWNPQFWSYRQLVAIQFRTEEDLDAAIDLLWDDSELQGLPHVHVGDWTMIIPAQAVDCFQRKARNFCIKSVVSAGDLPPEEINRIRREE
jgi:hypothetical protein